MNMLREQVRADLLAFSRRPETLFFTVFLPVIFLVLFEAIFGGQLITLSDGTKVEQSTLQVPAFMTMGIISASFVALAITVVNRRETGTFKRVRGTPAPAWILIAGQVVTSLVIALLMVLVMLVLGRLAYGVHVDAAHLPWLIVGVLLGAAAFSCLGMMLAAITPSTEAAPPLANVVVLPLYFISGVFVPVDSLPTWLGNVASVLPVAPLVKVLSWPYVATTATPWRSLGLVAVWGVIGLIIASWRFRWTPRRG
jgi:ABC-2 type transport system permease protein